MRALLQDNLTGEFVRTPSGWTEDRAQATEFASALEAIEYADDHGLHGLVVLSADAKPQTDETCPRISARTLASEQPPLT